ncbi:MAG TPA: O-antigen ligase family protein [Puia sp.]|jgi:O-antigen ligase|nr:O-antigen ligase family protein [Puia sp.]
MQQKVIFFLVLAVIATTIFSWFNVNSCLIILLVICRLAFGGRPLAVVRTAFSNRYFLAYFSLFLIEALGLLYTHDLYTAYKHVESKATLVAIPFVLCGGGFTDRKGYRQLLWGYCFLLAAACLVCLGVAVTAFRQTGDPDAFFYHSLTEVLELNAVFFSGYVLCGILFLLSPDGRGRFRSVLIALFTVMMILLSSKLLLVLLAVIFLVYLREWGRMRLKTGQLIGFVLLVILGSGLLAFTKTPMGQRYREILHDDLQYTDTRTIPPNAVFNGVSLRLLIWRFAGEILDENGRWLIGVSAGDSQDLLNRKYLEANMSRGFLGYNFHNQYIEVLVRSGIAGLCVFLAAIGVLVGLARRTGTLEGWFVLGMLLLMAMTESTLEMQHSLFLFAFFPLVFAIPSLDSLPGSSSPREGRGSSRS